jgi:hypothetical protein
MQKSNKRGKGKSALEKVKGTKRRTKEARRYQAYEIETVGRRSRYKVFILVCIRGLSHVFPSTRV